MDVSYSIPAGAGVARAPVADRRGRGAVAVWLWCVAALVFAMVVVGGATRLTQSGLSIVEWRPVTGVVPPLSQADWQSEFDKYKTIPQYERLNRGMSLDEFKAIYWWEWGHRLLGRLIGAVFLMPFLWFLWRGYVDRRLALSLAGIFGLGAVQGAVGWWMVASGLTERVSVSQYRLAFHLTLACVIYAVLVWTAARTGAGVRAAVAPRAARYWMTAAALLVLVLAQIYLGALVAGLHAGLIYNTWPLIDGSVIPSGADLWFDRPLWRNLFENPLTVQFDHRMVAYAIGAIVLLHLVDVWRAKSGGPLRAGATMLTAAVALQVALGIATLLLTVPLWLALFHQAVALIVLTTATWHASRAVPSLQPAA